ncbi:MAG: helix-turn-helix transcriptional regulator [Pseudonocardiales bacterium]|nr:helix-turn-helix transcriptional regulator [Pseudonocardiales bacterium]
MLLREWRDRRRLSQLDLSLAAGVSSRHLSFVETGRSRPTSGLIVRLAEELEIPLRERNRLLLAAGFAPRYRDHDFGSPQLESIRAAVRQVLSAYEPYPALAVNGVWEMVEANAGIALFLDGCAEWLLAPPVNVLRLSLHPEGAAPRIVNLAQWRDHVLARLERQVVVTASPVLAALLVEIRGYGPVMPGHDDGGDAGPGAGRLAVPLRLRHPAGELTFLSITSVFGAPMDIALDELAIESFLPADEHTARVLQAGAPVASPGPSGKRGGA